VIDFEDVSVRLGGHLIVDQIDLHVDRGGWTCLIGPNGAGKTTLLRTAIGGVKHSGRVRVAGEKVTSAHQSRIAYVSQRPGVPEGMSVGEYVRLGRFPFGSTRTDKNGTGVVAGLLEELNLDGNEKQAITSLSGCVSAGSTSPASRRTHQRPRFASPDSGARCDRSATTGRHDGPLDNARHNPRRHVRR
jgi:ABC-type cobalamin/Fe3+-siderophores transport system ATPase subunit